MQRFLKIIICIVICLSYLNAFSEELACNVDACNNNTLCCDLTECEDVHRDSATSCHTKIDGTEDCCGACTNKQTCEWYQVWGEQTEQDICKCVCVKDEPKKDDGTGVCPEGVEWDSEKCACACGDTSEDKAKCQEKKEAGGFYSWEERTCSCNCIMPTGNIPEGKSWSDTSCKWVCKGDGDRALTNECVSRNELGSEGPQWTWVEDSCECQCVATEACASGYELDESTCACVPVTVTPEESVSFVCESDEVLCEAKLDGVDLSLYTWCCKSYQQCGSMGNCIDSSIITPETPTITPEESISSYCKSGESICYLPLSFGSYTPQYMCCKSYQQCVNSGQIGAACVEISGSISTSTETESGTETTTTTPWGSDSISTSTQTGSDSITTTTHTGSDSISTSTQTGSDSITTTTHTGSDSISTSTTLTITAPEGSGLGGESTASVSGDSSPSSYETTASGRGVTESPNPSETTISGDLEETGTQDSTTSLEESGSPKVSGTPETTVSPEASVTPEQTISCPDGETPYFDGYEYDCCPNDGIIYDKADGYQDCCDGIIYDKADGYRGCCPAGGIIFDVFDGRRGCCPAGGIVYDKANGYRDCCPNDGIIYDKADGYQDCCDGIIYDKADGYEDCCPWYKKVSVDNVTGEPGVCCDKSKTITLADGTPRCCSEMVVYTDDGKCCPEDAYYNNGAWHCCPKPGVVAHPSDYSLELTCCTTGTVINEYGSPVCKGCSDEENTYTYTDVEGNLVNGCCDGDVCGEEGAQLCCEVNNSEACKTIVGSDGESSTCCPVCPEECPEGQACLNGSCTKVTCPVLLSLCQSNTNGSLNAACDYADALKAFGYNEQAMCEEAFQSEKESLDPYIDELLELDTSDTSRLAEIIKELLNDSYITSVDFGEIKYNAYCQSSGTCYPYKGTDEIEDDIVKTDYVCDMSGDICRNSKIIISTELLESGKLPCLFSTVLHEHVHANQSAGQYGPCWAALYTSGYNGSSCFMAGSRHYKRYQNSPLEQLAWCVTKKIQDYLNEKFGTSETCNNDYTDIGMIP